MLDMFFRPRNVAVIGASATPGKLGNDVMRNLSSGGFQGGIYPINPKPGEILGYKTYPSILDVPEPVDLVIIVVPAAVVPEVLEESGRKGVKGAIIMSAGFKEAGPEGAALEQRVLEIARQYGMRIIGPNCLGLIHTYASLNASFAPVTPGQGSIAFISQSGALGAAILDYALAENIGFSYFVSLGNKADVDDVALLEAWAKDENTKVIIAYIEGISDGSAFMQGALKTSRKKPIIAVKSGRTAAGSRAVSSHTGSLAGSDAAYDAAFAQSGVLRADSVQELFDYSTAFAYQPPLLDNRIAIVTNAGGPGVMATDSLERNGLVLAHLSAETEAALAEALPPAANIHNPIDVLGDAKSDRYAKALEAALADPGVDGVLVILTPQAMTESDETAEMVIERSRTATKPIMTCWMGGTRVAQATRLLAEQKVPNYPFPERATGAFGAMLKYTRVLQEPLAEIPTYDVDKEAVERLFAGVRAAGRNSIGDAEAQEILVAYGVPTPRSRVAATPEEAVAFSREIGYPVVMKIASPDILHKSDVGGIIVNVRSDDEVRQAFETLVARAKEHVPEATIWGAQVQEMVTDAREVIIGMNRDPQFGPLVMFGLGGIYVEVLRDVTFRLAPMTKAQARSMIEGIRSYPLLRGVRGQAPADLDSVTDTILRVSQLVTDFPEIAELDINPLLVRDQGQGAVAVDMRLILK